MTGESHFSALHPRRHSSSKIPYTELDVITNFSFLYGGSHPHEYVEQAKSLNYRGAGIADINSFAGVVRGYEAGDRLSFPCFTGTRITLLQELESVESHLPLALICYPYDIKGYVALSSLLTLGKRRAPKGECYLTLNDLFSHWENLVCIISPVNPFLCSSFITPASNFSETVAKLYQNKKNDIYLYLGLTHHYHHNARMRLKQIHAVSKKHNIPLVATNGVRFHVPERKPLHDIITCIRTHQTIDTAGTRLQQNAEQYLKPLPLIAYLFRETPDAIKRTQEIHEKISSFSLAQLSYEYPDEKSPGELSSFEYLSSLTWQGAQKRYPEGMPEKVSRLIKEELALIDDLNYSKYFLTCHTIVSFAKKQGILCQGRGSAANSAVCYCLGITAVPPDKIDLLFARFVNKERKEPPDIDIDFEHERREEVIQYIYSRYGREHAALTAVVITYRHRSAIREVAGALGFPPEVIDRLAQNVHRWTGCQIPVELLNEAGISSEMPRLQELFALTEELKGFPRHLSQHVGGFIISREPLSSIVPILNASMADRTTIEWDKDDIEVLGMLKIDVLGLGMLSCLRKAFSLVNKQRKRLKLPPLSLYEIPHDDSEVYSMISAADTIGVFQIESRAQMSMLPRLKPRCFYDLVIEVAIVRPGPIQGDMIHPYLKRRNGKEKISFPDKEVEEILGKTLGVPLFQEQAMRLAIVLAGFSPGEAEKLRKALAAWRRNKEAIAIFQDKILKGMLQRGYSREFADGCIRQIQGFSEYGFPESHAASFALLVYASAWIKYHYPAAFAAALINSLPMGFYAPAQIIQDARAHNVTVLPVDIHYSSWNCTLETHAGSSALRNGMRLIKGLSQSQAELLVLSRNHNGKFKSISDLWFRTRQANIALQKSTLRLLAHADAFCSLGLNRRKALWEIQSLPAVPLPLDFIQPKPSPHSLPSLSPQQEMFGDYASTGFSLRGHPLSYLRKVLDAKRVVTAKTLGKPEYRPGLRVRCAGIVLFRQRPGTAKGVVFVTLEDETGMINLIVPPEYFAEHSTLVIQSKCLLVEGKLQKIGPVIYVVVQRLACLEGQLARISHDTRLPRDRSYSY